MPTIVPLVLVLVLVLSIRISISTSISGIINTRISTSTSISISNGTCVCSLRRCNTDRPTSKPSTTSGCSNRRLRTTWGGASVLQKADKIPIMMITTIVVIMWIMTDVDNDSNHNDN